MDARAANPATAGRDDLALATGLDPRYGKRMSPARQPIEIDAFVARSFHLWSQRWFLLTAGDFAKGEFNTMTVSWGSLGVMWGIPFAQVVVRPVRYTFEFMERFPTFTLCAFPESQQDALRYLGSKSGRDGDKIAEAELTPVAAARVAAPAFAEAELVIECRKMYWHDLEPGHFLDPRIAGNYAQSDYHRSYFGEVLAIEGTATHAHA